MWTCENPIRLNSFCVVFLAVGVCFAESSDALATQSAGLEIKCGEAKLTITVKRLFLRQRQVPFRAEFVRLGLNATQQSSCGPQKSAESESQLVIIAGLQECGTKARVQGEWLVYSNQLFLFPAVALTSAGGLMLRELTTVIPVECHYKRKQTVNGEPVTPTWQPMTSTISALGLLRFSLHIMTADCTSPRSSPVHQQGEAVFLEASVEAPLQPPLTVYVDYCIATLKPDPLSLPSYKFINKHGCLMDSLLPGSSSRFIRGEQSKRMCFSFQAFHFNQESGQQMFITCHLRANLKEDSNNRHDKACYFHRPTFSWHATEGDNAVCGCCDSDDCNTQETQSITENTHEGDTTVGPLQTLLSSHWPGRLSILND